MERICIGKNLKLSKNIGNWDRVVYAILFRLYTYKSVFLTFARRKKRFFVQNIANFAKPYTHRHIYRNF